MLLVFNDKFGQSLLEIIIAIAIFSLIGAAIATMVTGSLSVLTKGGDQIEADALAQEAIEAVRSVHDGAWNEIIYDSAVLSTSSSQWIISSGLSELIGSRFTRTITFEDVCRDSLDNIDICPSNYVDVNSKKVTVIVSWEVREGVTNSVQRIAYLTNWDSRDWVQTDWVDGNGQIEWSDPEMYDFSIDINTTDTAGQITLADEEDGSWTLSGGKEVIDTTDIDFNSGLFTDIIVRDIDVDASLILATTTTWALHNDSSSTTIEQLNDISFISTSSAWAVGDSGKILNFTGLSWLEDSDIGTTDLNGIDMISDSDGWAVGDGGERYKYNGTTWAQDIGQAVVDATDADFNLGEFSGTEVSGIGDEAKLILSQSISWAEHGDSGSISIDINDISIVSSSDIWAGADSGKIIHFNGVGWTETIDLGNSNVNGIKMRTSSDGWAVGNSGKIWHYNGTNWNEDDDTGRETWNDVAPIANNDVWVVGEGGSLARYDGSSWIEYDIPNSANIESIFAISSSDIWAVGASGRIWHYDGASWSLNIDTGNETWYGLVMLSASSGWAVGSSGRVAEYNGITWTESTLPSSADILEVHAISSSNIWATGASGRIWHYDGASWSLNIDIGNEVWNGISMAGADEGWVVGDDGKIYQLSTFYNNSGTFLSQVFDSGIEDISWDTANWTEVLPPGADLTIAVRTGNTSIPDGSWTSFTSENTNPITSDLNVLEGRYLQYRATLSIGDSASESPELEDITINYAGEVTTQNLNAISTVSSSDIWAVGQNATIIHYDGNLWTSASTNISEDINGIDMLSTSDGWAVGDSGKILRFQNGNWSQYSDTGREIWNSVAAINANDAWAVGNDGKIAHFNGSSWTESTIPSSAHILAVHALTSSNIWAVGDSGRFWRYDGNNWALELDTGGEILRGIEMISASSGWVIGSNGVIYEYGVFYYNSGVFESRIIDSGEAGTEWNYASWREILPNGADITISTRSGNTSFPDGSWSSYSDEKIDNLGDVLSSPDGRYLQYRATFTRGFLGHETPELLELTIIYNAATTRTLNGISIISPSDIWAVGESGKIIHYDGVIWSEHTDTGGETWNDITSVSANDIWAVGNSGALAHFDGAAWSESLAPSADDIMGTDFFSSSDVWAVGRSGRIWHYNGIEWLLDADTGNETWNDIAIISANDIWAVGNSGVLAHFDGASWVESTISSSNNINGIFIVSANDIWAVGGSGRIWHYNGSNWSLHTDTGGETWQAIYLISDSDGWTVGSNGVIGRWLGSSWNGNFSSPTSRNINDLAMESASSGWAVGDNGIILHFSRDLLYSTNGYLVSSDFNIGTTSFIQAIKWDETLPICNPACEIKFQIKTALTQGGLESAEWCGPNGKDGDEIDYFTVSAGQLIHTNHNNDQWIKYKVILSGDGYITPVLREMDVNYK